MFEAAFTESFDKHTGTFTLTVMSFVFLFIVRSIGKIIAKNLDTMKNEKKFVFYFEQCVAHATVGLIFSKVFYDLYLLDSVFDELPHETVEWVTLGSTMITVMAMFDTLNANEVSLDIMIHHTVVASILCIAFDGCYFPSMQNDRALQLYVWLFGMLWSCSVPNYMSLCCYYCLSKNSILLRDILYWSFIYRTVLFFVQYGALTAAIFQLLPYMVPLSKGFAWITYFGCLVPNILSFVNLYGLYCKQEKEIRNYLNKVPAVESPKRKHCA